MNIVKSILIDGNIPYFKIIKKKLVYLAFLAFFIFIFPQEFKLFGETGWRILIIIIFSRPLSDIFPKIGLLKKLVLLRKELGIICGVFIISHFIGYLLIFNIPLIIFLNPKIWSFSSHITWGFLGFIVMLPILFTSNIFSIIKLGKYWKKLQRFTYVFYLFGALHIALVNSEKSIYMIVLSVLLLIVWTLAYKKILLWK